MGTPTASMDSTPSCDCRFGQIVVIWCASSYPSEACGIGILFAGFYFQWGRGQELGRLKHIQPASSEKEHGLDCDTWESSVGGLMETLCCKDIYGESGIE